MSSPTASSDRTRRLDSLTGQLEILSSQTARITRRCAILRDEFSRYYNSRHPNNTFGIIQEINTLGDEIKAFDEIENTIMYQIRSIHAT